MVRTVYKHTAHHELLEAFRAAKACALCDFRVRGARRYLESLLRGHVNDPGVRGKLALSRGFCGRHARMLLETGDGLGTAILYQDQVRLALEFLQGLGNAGARTIRGKSLEEWRRRAPCPACALEERGDAARIETLLGGWEDPEMRGAFMESPGLCFPHLLGALAAAGKGETQREILGMHREKFQDLLGQLGEYCRKHDHRHSGEPFGVEADSWRRAVDMLLGTK